MLKSIYISNFAIIEKLELELFTGMHVLSGETGAGKSIIIDALNLALGNRADRSVAKDGSKKVEVVATIDISHAKQAIHWLQERDLVCGDDCVLRRIISIDGKSKAYINDTPCPVTVLRSLGSLFVDVYGQHEHQSLMRKDKQRQLLDGFSGNAEKIEQLAALFQHWKDLNNQLQTIEKNKENTLSQLELLRYQHQELVQLGLNEDEYTELNDQYIRLANAKELNAGSMRIAQQLAGEEDATIYDQLNTAIFALKKLSGTDQSLEEPLENIQNIPIQLKEIALTLRDYSERVSLDPQQLQQVEERMGAIEEVARKHNVKPQELVSLQASIGADLEKLEGQHANPQKIRQAMQAEEQHYRLLAQEISLSRHQTAQQLNADITASMQSLGMRGGRFYIDVQAKKTQQLSQNGLDKIQFIVSTSSAQSLRPLNKVASGGELSRLSLAIQMTTANNLGIPTLIFDEVDIGVGGATAEIVGRHLRRLGKNAQVFCVTHLAQVAAQAHHHYKVSKCEQNGVITTAVSHLTEDARIQELARMLGGVEMTKNTHMRAQEMLQQIKS